MLNAIQEQLNDYLKYTDIEVKSVQKELHKNYNKIIKECMDMYDKQVNESPMIDEMKELRQACNNMRYKYEKEVEKSNKKDQHIAKLNAKIAKMQDKLDIYKRDERIKYRSDHKIERPCRVKSEDTPKREKKSNIGQVQNRVLSLKQLKDVINDIYLQKLKFDKKCSEYKQPKETMEQYVYTYLNQKYGLKSLTIEWLLAIVNGIANFKSLDHEVKLFGKILKNECDEQFRAI